MLNEEVVAMVLGLLAAGRLGADVEDTFTKIDRVLPDTLRRRVEAARGDPRLHGGRPAGSARAGRLGELIETGEGTLVRMRVGSLDWMAGVLAGLDCPFTIRRPDELREAVRAQGASGLWSRLDDSRWLERSGSDRSVW